MSPAIIAAVAAASVIVIILVIVSALSGRNKGEARTKKILSRIQSEAEATAEEIAERNKAALKQTDDKSFLDSLPFIGSTREMLKQAGTEFPPRKFVLYLISIGILGGYLLQKAGLGPAGFLISFPFAFLLLRWMVGRINKKRQEAFVNMFPDAVDMIVRSVRSGHPLNAAFRMIAENMEDPVAGEFKQVLDEIQYGRTLSYAIDAMAERINQQDVRFFVVVINVQQESGGNLGEVLSNLSKVLRGRKQLRLKIKALTAEGRMTAYILGSLPLFVMGVLQVLSPGYLVPLFDEPLGNFILGLALGMVALAFFVVNKMIQIDI